MVRWSRPVTTMPHCAPWAWEGTSNLSSARKKTAWPSGPEIIHPSKPSKGVSTCGRSWIQNAKGFKAAPFPSSVAAEAGGEVKGEHLARTADVTNSSEVEALVGTALEEWGGLDIMVNNA